MSKHISICRNTLSNMRTTCALALTTVLLACGARPAPHVVSQDVTSRENAFEVREDFAQYFAAEGVNGATVVWDRTGNTRFVYQPQLAALRHLPASTFKIPNSAIALETGAASDLDMELPWDGVVRSIPAWNQNHTLRTAYRDSAVWYYQELARRVGEDTMSQWVRRLQYGNTDIGGGIDRFWLSGNLRISPHEQIDFLARLEQGQLGLSARTDRLLRELMILEQADTHTLRGKTGWVQNTTDSVNASEASAGEVGWFVGWLETNDKVVFFATVVLDPPPNRMLASRRAVTEQILHGLGYY